MAGLLLAGKTICCAASWVRPSLPMKLWAQVSSRPDTISVTARNRPATLTSMSNVRRFIAVLLGLAHDGLGPYWLRVAPGRAGCGVCWGRPDFPVSEPNLY